MRRQRSYAQQQVINLTFSGFGTPVTMSRCRRCLLAATASEVDNAIGLAATGGIEECQVTISGLDYGAAPDTARVSAQATISRHR